MRTALLAASRSTPDGTLRAGLMFGGRSVLEWQAQMACDLGCGRMIVLAETASDTIVAAQQAVERRGVQVHCLKGFSRLPALLHSDDEVLIIADGLIPDHAQVKALLGPPAGDGKAAVTQHPVALRKAVLCLDSHHPLALAHPADFERVDATRCWAGVLAMRGAPAQNLDGLAPDSDAVSLLLRLALQAGTECLTLGAEAIAPGEWLLASDAASLREREMALIRQHTAPPRYGAPGAALAHRLAAMVSPGTLDTATRIATGTALCAMLAAIVVASLGHGFAALGVTLLASFAFGLARAFMQMRARLQQRVIPATFAWLHDPGADVLASIALAIVLAPPFGMAPVAALAPLTFGLLRLASTATPAKQAAFWQDRPAHLALLTIAAAFGVLPEGAAILGIAALAATLLQTKAYRPQGDGQS